MVASRQLDEFVQVPEGRIHYVKIGSGPPLVIFHGGGSSSLSWIPAMELMGKAFTSYAFDILGHGDSEEPPRESFSIPDHGRTMNQAMDSLGIKRAHVLGNLSGASLAIEMAASYPEKVDKLVLAVPPVIDPRTTPEQVKATAVLFSEGGGAVARDAESMRAGAHFYDPKPEFVDQLNASRAKAGKWTHHHSATNAWYDMVARMPIIKPSATLIIMGEICRYNEIVDIMVFNLPNASKVIIPKTGNFVYVEDAKAFTSAVMEFLK